jgi:hypothetical protein
MPSKHQIWVGVVDRAERSDDYPFTVYDDVTVRAANRTQAERLIQARLGADDRIIRVGYGITTYADRPVAGVPRQRFARPLHWVESE